LSLSPLRAVALAGSMGGATEEVLAMAGSMAGSTDGTGDTGDLSIIRIFTVG